MSKSVVVTPYDPTWTDQFHTLGREIRTALGDRALRIDHIGSTAVIGLAAKPIIDIQISVATFDPFAPLHDPLANLGYVWQPDNPAKSKRYFREPDSADEIHVHMRLHGNWFEQHALLFRDYLRQNDADRAAYGQLKQQLAVQYSDDRKAYQAAKADFIWDLTRRAHGWGYATGWQAGESDA